MISQKTCIGAKFQEKGDSKELKETNAESMQTKRGQSKVGMMMVGGIGCKKPDRKLGKCAERGAQINLCAECTK